MIEICDTKIEVEEKGHSYYDDIYNDGYDVEHMRPIYETVLKMLGGFRSIRPRVLEIGCGTGVFGAMIHANGFGYRGFDFSAVAIRRCPHAIRTRVTRRNAYHRAAYRVSHNVVVAIETMEHVRDLEVVEHISAGTACIFTLPNFTDEAHLRTYLNAADIKRHYKGLIRWSNIVPVKMVEDDDVNGGFKVIYVCKGVRV